MLTVFITLACLYTDTGWCSRMGLRECRRTCSQADSAEEEIFYCEIVAWHNLNSNFVQFKQHFRYIINYIYLFAEHNCF